MSCSSAATAIPAHRRYRGAPQDEVGAGGNRRAPWSRQHLAPARRRASINGERCGVDTLGWRPTQRSVRLNWRSAMSADAMGHTCDPSLATVAAQIVSRWGSTEVLQTNGERPDRPGPADERTERHTDSSHVHRRLVEGPQLVERISHESRRTRREHVGPKRRSGWVTVRAVEEMRVCLTVAKDQPRCWGEFGHPCGIQRDELAVLDSPRDCNCRQSSVQR